MGHLEGHAQPGGGVDALHLRGHVAANECAVARTAAEAERAHFGNLQVALRANVEVLNLNPLAFKGGARIKIGREDVHSAGAGVRVVRAEVGAPHRRADAAQIVRVQADAVVAEAIRATAVVAVEHFKAGEGDRLRQPHLVGEGGSQIQIVREGAEVPVGQVLQRAVRRPGGQDRSAARPVGGVGAEFGVLKIARPTIGACLHLDPAPGESAVGIEAGRDEVAPADAGVGVVRADVCAPNGGPDGRSGVGVQRDRVVAQAIRTATVIAIKQFDVLQGEGAAQIYDEIKVRHQGVVVGEGAEVAVGEIFLHQARPGVTRRDDGAAQRDIDQIGSWGRWRVVTDGVGDAQPVCVVEGFVAAQPHRTQLGVAGGGGDQEPGKRPRGEQRRAEHLLRQSKRDIFPLRRKGGRKLARDAVVRANQPEVLAPAVELEVGVQLARGVGHALA